MRNAHVRDIIRTLEHCTFATTANISPLVWVKHFIFFSVSKKKKPLSINWPYYNEWFSFGSHSQQYRLLQLTHELSFLFTMIFWLLLVLLGVWCRWCGFQRIYELYMNLGSVNSVFFKLWSVVFRHVYYTKFQHTNKDRIERTKQIFFVALLVYSKFKQKNNDNKIFINRIRKKNNEIKMWNEKK